MSSPANINEEAAASQQPAISDMGSSSKSSEQQHPAGPSDAPPVGPGQVSDVVASHATEIASAQICSPQSELRTGTALSTHSCEQKPQITGALNTADSEPSVALDGSNRTSATFSLPSGTLVPSAGTVPLSVFPATASHSTKELFELWPGQLPPEPNEVKPTATSSSSTVDRSCTSHQLFSTNTSSTITTRPAYAPLTTAYSSNPLRAAAGYAPLSGGSASSCNPPQLQPSINSQQCPTNYAALSAQYSSYSLRYSLFHTDTLSHSHILTSFRTSYLDAYEYIKIRPLLHSQKPVLADARQEQGARGEAANARGGGAQATARQEEEGLVMMPCREEPLVRILTLLLFMLFLALFLQSPNAYTTFILVLIECIQNRKKLNVMYCISDYTIVIYTCLYLPRTARANYY